MSFAEIFTQHAKHFLTIFVLKIWMSILLPFDVSQKLLDELKSLQMPYSEASDLSLHCFLVPVQVVRVTTIIILPLPLIQE